MQMQYYGYRYTGTEIDIETGKPTESRANALANLISSFILFGRTPLMPEISRFFGMVITMYYNDHNPPHFHVRYGQQRALISIQSLSVIEGELRSRALGLVVEWASLHQNELMDNWERARLEQSLLSIDPLE